MEHLQQQQQHVKTLNTDDRGKNRLRYKSSRQRAKRASADVYRSYKRRIGAVVTSAASREERVHHPNQEESNQRRKKRQRRSHDNNQGEDKVAVLRSTTTAVEEEDAHGFSSWEEESDFDTESNFGSELDLAHERNPSEMFRHFYRDAWHLARSLPEVLHHAAEIVDLLMSYLLSPESDEFSKSPSMSSVPGLGSAKRETYVVNHATTDLLHLLAVLARDLRHEIHPFVHSLIVPRIFNDLLNPPLPPPDSGKQPLPLDVAIVEAAFRTISYVFRYDAEPLLAEVDKEGQKDPCLERMSHYYGGTLAHKRDYVRRLAAETFAPLIRKLKSDGSRRRHLRRVLRALANSVVAQSSFREKDDDNDGRPLRDRLTRSQADAVDGISLLFFETARGVNGRLHSKGHHIIRCLLDYLIAPGDTSKHSPNENERQMVQLVASSFFDKLYHHVVDKAAFQTTWKEILRAANTVIGDTSELTHKTELWSPLHAILTVLHHAASFRDGQLLRAQPKSILPLVEVLEKLLDIDHFSNISVSLQELTLRAFSAAWKAVPEDRLFVSRLSGRLPNILCNVTIEENNSFQPAILLAQDLLPCLPCNIGIKTVGKAVLSAAAQKAESNPSLSLKLLFSVSSTTREKSSTRLDDADDDCDDLFVLDGASDCDISSDEKEKLLDLCLVMTSNLSTAKFERDKIAQFCVSARCLPFLVMAGSSNENQRVCLSHQKRVWKWAKQTLSALGKCQGLNDDGYETASVLVARCLVLESAARLASALNTAGYNLSAARKDIEKLDNFAKDLILSRPQSIWVVKSVASFLEARKIFEIDFSENTNEVFDALTPNLRSESHFIRLHSLQILESFPKRPYVMDHAEIDWTDDLDEEPSVNQGKQTNVREIEQRSGPSGLCGIPSVLLELESTPISLKNERRILSCITRVEVLGRTARLPVVYAEMAASHLLGVLHVKFAPIWPAAVRALVAIASRNEEAVWEPLSYLLKEKSLPSSESSCALGSDISEGTFPDFADHLDACVSWDMSGGRNAALFRQSILEAEVNGRISRHLFTDQSTVFEFVCSALENAPELAAKHSRVVVPLFLEFLHFQYYVFYDNDPDARELCLQAEVAQNSGRWPREMLHRKELHKRLHGYLKIFAAVNGPRQLFKHTLLLSVFSVFLSHQDAAIAQTALECLLKFKLPYLLPYADHLSGMLKRSKLRETMLRFNISKEEGSVDPEHRSQLIPIIARIMFGRLSSRATIAKASNESPAARRAAVLSFLSVLDESAMELYPLFYLMVRVYVPSSHKLKPLEQQEEREQDGIGHLLKSIQSEEISRIAEQRHEGFLNLLLSVVSQLGHKMEKYVPAFMSIILSLCKYSEIKGGNTRSEIGREGDEKNEPFHAGDRRAAIRTLCFRRLAEFFDQYADFVDFLPYAKPMWAAIDASVRNLPAAALTSEKAPALLIMLQRISSHPNLIPLLSVHEEAVQRVIECIANTSHPSVMNSALAFLDNLLTNGQTVAEHDAQQDGDHHVGISLIRKYVHLLLRHFSFRLTSTSATTSSNLLAPGRVCPARNQTTWRELSILCRVSRFFVEEGSPVHNLETESSVQADLTILCDLLVTFLGPSTKSSESDQLNVIEILSILLPRVGKDTALSHLLLLSKFMGPFKAGCGIDSLLIRKKLALLIQAVCDCPGISNEQKTVAEKVVHLCSTDPRRVGEMNYDRILTVLNDLTDQKSSSNNWLGLVGNFEKSPSCDPAPLCPLIKCCFHLVYNDDGVVSRGAFKALKSLVICASNQSRKARLAIESPEKTLRLDQWMKLVETWVVPDIRGGLNARSQPIRRLFILLLAQVARCYSDYQAPNLHGDLSQLIQDDEPDTDFFLAITHVQIHRRTRALQRLRKTVSDDAVGHCRFSMQSLSNVLLPIALHPIYESKTKLEEPLAMESIETVGAVARHLSWSKYHNTLWTALTQFGRHRQQERYIIGMICSMLDSFHFDVLETETSKSTQVSDDSQTNVAQNAVWRALENRIIPKTESLLMKEKLNRDGEKVKMLRPPVVLALLKLFQKFPTSIFDSKLPRLLAIINSGLKNRDSDAREVARVTLGKMVLGMDTKYLQEVVNQLATSLTEGYMLHVRIAALHTILLKLSSAYECPTLDGQNAVPPFDRCIPGMMDLIQEDLFGEANERREAEEAQIRFVKEAAGSKANDCIEIMCRLILFKPSMAAPTGFNNFAGYSAIHSIVRPLLEKLSAPDVDMVAIRKIRESLSRVVVGLSHNPTTTPSEVFPFIYASVTPFIVSSSSIFGAEEAREIDDSDSEDQPRKLEVSGSSTSVKHQKQTNSHSKNARLIEWRPSVLKTAANCRDAREAKNEQSRDIRRVLDGVSAPKLTGSSRISSARTVPSLRLNDPASVSAVLFGLSLLNSTLKKIKLNREDESVRDMLDPFIPTLTTCVCECRDNDAVLLSLRCLGSLLRMKLPSTETCSKALGTQCLLILTSSGSLSNLHQELTQACFKSITLLLSTDTGRDAKLSDKEAQLIGEEVLHNDNSMPLNASQMQVLISLLKGAAVDSAHHNPTFGLIKAITSRRYLSPEFYDLMDTCLELSVRSQKASVREMSAGIFMQYLMDYPMGKDRLESHLKQIVLNIKYEYEEGRLAAVRLISTTIEKLPIPLLEEHGQMFFLPLVLQLVNDDSKQCREDVAKCLERLLQRVSLDMVQSFYDYALRWSQGTGPLQRTSMQLFGLLVNARIDFLKQNDTASTLCDRLCNFLHGPDSPDEWEIRYFGLICVEKMTLSFASQLKQHPDCFVAVIENLAHSHLWVKQVSSRIVVSQLTRIDANKFGECPENVFVKRPGLLYKLARNLCTHLGLQEAEQSDELSTSAIKSLTWLVQAMSSFPKLCFTEDSDDESREPVKWVMSRLSQIAKPKGTKRRSSIFKCFAAFASNLGSNMVGPFLETILEPLNRSILEAEHKASARTESLSNDILQESEETVLARDVLQLLEECCSEQFLQALANVKTRAREKKEIRKQKAAAEAIRDPETAALRKLKKQEAEKKRRKRRVEEHRQQRGGKAKRRHF